MSGLAGAGTSDPAIAPPPVGCTAGRGTRIHRFGTFLAYVYVLRVPLLTWLLLAVLPWVALPRDAVAGSLLRGLFDIVDPQERYALVPLVTFALLTLTVLMVAATITITARLILLDGHERFDIDPLPPSPGIQLAVRLIPLGGAIAIILGAWIQSWDNIRFWKASVGIVVGAGAFVLLMKVIHEWLWDEVFVKRRTFLTTNNLVVAVASFIFEGFRRFVKLTPCGFVDRSGRIWARHAFAVLQFLFSVLFYVGLFGLKSNWARPIGGLSAWLATFSPRIPTLCLVLVLAMLLCWALSGLTFALDRYRVPLLTALLAYGGVISTTSWDDHFFQSVPHRDPRVESVTADGVLGHRSGAPAIVIAAAGGGIQAAAWTARVIAGLQQDAQACGDAFDEALVAISAVSGGSVGAMYIADAYRSGHLRDLQALDGAVSAAEASSLDEVAWGLTYPDFVWTIAPFLKGVYRPFLVKDRGSALEDAWKRTETLSTATLDMWRADLQHGLRPAVLFNATVAENGQRMLLATTTLETKAGDVGRREFANDPRTMNVDLPVTTAARLSATFPYVSPAARINRYGGFDDQYHYVDGGYYDNYGTATLVEWLDTGLKRLGRAMPSRVLVLQIRSFPDSPPAPPDGRRGWIFETVQPVETLYAVRGTGQSAHSDLNVQLLEDDYGGDLIHDVIIPFPARVADEQDDQAPPLSWHLTPADRGRLAAAWRDEQVYQQRVKVHQFLRPDDANQNHCVPR